MLPSFRLSMRFITQNLVILAGLAATASATHYFNSKAFDSALTKRQSSGNASSSDLVVDLGYELYQGVANSSTGLNIWKGYALRLQFLSVENG